MLTSVLASWRNPARYVLGRRLQSSGSFFDNLPKSDEAVAATPSAPSTYNSNKDLRSHPDIASKLQPAPKRTLDLLSPLKRALYRKNLDLNGGLYVNNQIIKHDDGKSYRLRLSHEEQRALEPSVYARSYRIKGSWKKAYMWLRPFRRMALNEAITQCHFSARRMGKDVGEMLEQASKDAVRLGLNPETLVVDQIWVGKDGEDMRRLQCKGRGRTGVITSHFVHVKAILKPKQFLDQRQNWIKQRYDRKLWFPLRNFKIKEDYVQTANYKW